MGLCPRKHATVIKQDRDAIHPLNMDEKIGLVICIHLCDFKGNDTGFCLSTNKDASCVDMGFGAVPSWDFNDGNFCMQVKADKVGRIGWRVMMPHNRIHTEDFGGAILPLILHILPPRENHHLEGGKHCCNQEH